MEEANAFQTVSVWRQIESVLFFGNALTVLYTREPFSRMSIHPTVILFINEIEVATTTTTTTRPSTYQCKKHCVVDQFHSYIVCRCECNVFQNNRFFFSIYRKKSTNKFHFGFHRFTFHLADAHKLIVFFACTTN